MPVINHDSKKREPASVLRINPMHILIFSVFVGQMCIQHTGTKFPRHGDLHHYTTSIYFQTEFLFIISPCLSRIRT